MYPHCNYAASRHKIAVKKGDSIGGFLKAVRELLAPKYRELRHSSVSNMMYVKVGGTERGLWLRSPQF